MKGRINPEQLQRIIQSGLPGEKAQWRMAPEFRGAYEHPFDPVPAAVLVLIYPVHGKIRTAFMKRNAYDGPHSAQVSFPGGAWEPGDSSLEHTALRETREGGDPDPGKDYAPSYSRKQLPGISIYRVDRP